MSEQYRNRHRRRLEWSARDLPKKEQERVLGVDVAEDEQSDCIDSQDELAGPMPQRLLHRCTKVLRRLLAGKASPADFVGFDVDGLLAVRPARHWIDQIKHLGCKNRTSLSSLHLLRGPLTLYEALRTMGPDMAPAAGMVQAVSQQRLFESCTVGFDMAEWSVPLETLLRSGASLLRTDSRGRVAAHLAAAAECDVLGVLLHVAPAALLVKDSDGQTPLELLVDSPCLEQPCARTGVKDALIHGLLECLCASPQQTLQLLHKSENSLQVLMKLVEEPGASALLIMVSKSPEDLQPDKCAAEVNKRCAKAQRAESTSAATLHCTAQRVRILKAMLSDSTFEAANLEPQELQLRLLGLEAELRNQQCAAAEREAALEQELRRVKGLLAQCEDELITCGPSVQAESTAASQSSCHEPVGRGSGREITELVKHGTFGASDVAAEETKEGYEHSVIQSIRQMRLCTVNTETLAESVRICLSGMQASLAAAVDRLAKDLYDSETHFIHELIQNADDAVYTLGTVPELRFSLRLAEPGELPFFYAASNEKGFSEADVRALCDISRSTKSRTSGATTGHKGVGWKAVFRVCHAPHVLSGKWCFRFSSQGLGMITPEWVGAKEYMALPAEVQQLHTEGWTVFFLPLARSDIAASIVAEFSAMEANTAQLIFFRRLRRICVSSAEHELQMDLLPRRDDSTTGVVNQCVRVLTKQGSEQSKTTAWSSYAHEGVTVACPLVEELSSQHIFAVLPVRKVGFNFAVQAQFQLTTSRADLHRCPENVMLRNAAVTAFLNLCKSSEEVAAKAFEYLGQEPADTFWLSARMMILAGLQAVSCIPTEGGEHLLPSQCLLRGDSAAACWVPEDVLEKACGLRFVNPTARHGDLYDLGVRQFGFNELCTCLSYDDGSWTKSQWLNSSSTTFLSDVFEQLVRDLQVDALRIVEVQKLRIFPVLPEEEYRLCAAGHSSKKASLAACSAPMHVAADVYASFCPELPDDWQMSLIRRMSPELRLSKSAQDLLTLLGVTTPDEVALEREALRWLLRPGSVWPSMRATWPALHVLCLCHSSGRKPPRPWTELRGALLLPSESGELVPPSSLRLRSFLGVTPKLPAGVLHNVCKFAGLDVQPFEPCSLDLVKMPARTGLSWLEWEAFFWTLGCSYMNPMLDFGEACVEATLELGRVLSSTSFWQAIATKPCIKAYLRATIGNLSCPELRMWLRQLPVGEGHAVVSDLFLHNVFHTIGGDQLPYLKLTARDPDVTQLVRELGVAVGLDAAALFKCLHWMKTQDIQDIGLAADIYGELERSGCVELPADASVILLPGRGYIRPRFCCWTGFHSNLLQKCCPLQPISEVYARFGVWVQNLLARWVLPSPETHAATLCDTLRTLILYARHEVHGSTSVDRREAVAGLCEGAQIIVGMLATLCNENEADAITVRSVFMRNRMIVAFGCNGAAEKPYYRLLNISEAYWSVVPKLRCDPTARWQLQETYGANPLMEHFFVHILGVRPMLHENEKDKFSSTGATDVSAAEQDVVEGLKFEISKSSASEVRFDLAQALDNALQRARGSMENSMVKSAVSSKQERSRWKHPTTAGHMPEAASEQETIATIPVITRHHQEPRWQRVGEVGGFPLFSVSDEHLSADLDTFFSLGNESLELLHRLCDAFGLEPERLAFAYDPSGRYVGRDRLFLDASKISRASKLSIADATIFWTMELAQTIAHQGVGSDIDENLLSVMRELTLLFLPKMMPPI